MAQSFNKIKKELEKQYPTLSSGDRVFDTDEYNKTIEEWALNERERQLDVEKNGYKVERVSQYPSLAEQLDSLFKDIEAGFFGAKAKNSDFYKSIKLVKDSNPKPSEEE
jgi:hypothetical protein